MNLRLYYAELDLANALRSLESARERVRECSEWLDECRTRVEAVRDADSTDQGRPHEQE